MRVLANYHMLNVFKSFLIPIFGILLLFSHTAFCYDEFIVPVSAETDIDVVKYTAKGEYLALWLAPEYGFREQHQTFAELLNQQNIEVWQSNIAESLFLTQSPTSLRQLDGTHIAEIIEYASHTTGKKVFLIGDSYAAVNVLIGAHKWQQRKHKSAHLIGAILFSPFTYAYLPELGKTPEFMPIVSATNIPLMIYQAKNSGNVNQFENLITQLQQHNNPVYSKFMPDIFNLFYENPPTDQMTKQMHIVPRNIRKMIPILERHKLPLSPISFKNIIPTKSGKDIFLKEYIADMKTTPIDLADIDGTQFIKNSYKNQVTVVNFWATWCPPCVEEIPSLNRLAKKMKNTPFQLISINYAEDKNTIIDFMKRVNVEFPVLIDNKGSFAKQWNVVSYPSTFVIDLTGNIKYGVNSAIEWDSPEVIYKLKSLQTPQAD